MQDNGFDPASVADAPPEPSTSRETASGMFWSTSLACPAVWQIGVLPQNTKLHRLLKTSDMDMQTTVPKAKSHALQLPRLVKSNLIELHLAPLLFPPQHMLYQQPRASKIGSPDF